MAAPYASDLVQMQEDVLRYGLNTSSHVDVVSGRPLIYLARGDATHMRYHGMPPPGWGRITPK